MLISSFSSFHSESNLVFNYQQKLKKINDKNIKLKNNRYKIKNEKIMKIYNSNRFKNWYKRNSIICTSNLSVDIYNTLLESFLSCKKFRKLEENYKIESIPFQIRIERSMKSLKINHNGFGFDEIDLITTFKSICNPILYYSKKQLKKKNLENLKISSIPKEYQVQSLRIISKKITSKELLFFEIDFNNARFFTSKVFSSSPNSFTFLNLNIKETFRDNIFGQTFYGNLKKNLLVKPFWLTVEFNFLNKRQSLRIYKRKKNFKKMDKKFFLFSSIKFVSSEDYLRLFQNLSSRWTFPLCMLHLTFSSEPNIDVIIFIPRYFFPSFFKHDFFLFDNKKNYKNEKLELDLFLKKITPEWLFFGIGIAKIRKFSYQTIFLKKMDFQNEILLKNKISKKMFELLTNFSLKNIKWYNFFWSIYNSKLKINLVQNKNLLKKFSHLLRFFSTKSENGYVSIQNYVKNMKKDQTEIYFFYIKENDYRKIHPNLEVLIKEDVEVLLLFDSVDEVIIKLLEKEQERFGPNRISFKNIRLIEFYESNLFRKNRYNYVKWKPIFCMEWFSEKLKKKFLKIQNFTYLSSSSTSFVYLKDFSGSIYESFGNFKKKTNGMDLFWLRKQYMIFEINGANDLIRIINIYLKNKATTKLSNEIAILIWEITHVKCGLSPPNQENFPKRIENILIIFILVLYSRGFNLTKL